MITSDNNAVQLWRKAECHSRNATNLMLSQVTDHNELCELIKKALRELQSATCAMQELQRRSVGAVVQKIGD